jgi:hypothetical protein
MGLIIDLMAKLLGVAGGHSGSSDQLRFGWTSGEQHE